MTFGSLGYGPRAQSVLHCHGVLALRHGPWTPAWTEAVQNESRLQEDVWQSGIRAAGPIRPSLPWCFSPATRSLDSSLRAAGPRPRRGQNESRLQEDTSRVAVGTVHGVLALRHGPWKRCRTKAGSRRTPVQKRRKSQGLELVSSRFRK